VQGTIIFKAMYSNIRSLWDEDGECTFKFSTGWRRGFMKRWHFALRTPTNGNKDKLQPQELRDRIAVFHLEREVFQRSESNSLSYGYADPCAVFNRDEIPIQGFEDSKTLDEKGATVIWSVLADSDDKYRFATLNLTIPMRVLWAIDDNLPDAGEGRSKPVNLPFAHIIFKGQFGSGAFF
jgi:hypothetical protein